MIEFHAPDYLRNAVRIIAETGLRVYKELTVMKKDQVDLGNAVVWIPGSKTPNGVAEVPLTPLAAQAFQDQLRIAGPSDKNQSGHQTTLKTENRLAQDPEAREDWVFSDLRSEIDVCHPGQCWRRRRRVGNPDASARRREGLQEVLADEATDEARGSGEDQPAG
jgi:integrase